MLGTKDEQKMNKIALVLRKVLLLKGDKLYGTNKVGMNNQVLTLKKINQVLDWKSKHEKT